jgi:uncharacterized protein (TIGR03435 family)
MKRGEKVLVDQFVDQHLSLFSSPPSEEIVEAKKRAYVQLRLKSMVLSEEPAGELPALRPGWRWRFGLIGAAAVAAVLLVFAIMPGYKIDARAVVETEHDGLYRVSDKQALHAGETIEAGETVRTNRGAGAVLKLADGSGIEMRSNSALRLDQANDGVQIHLNAGSVIVNAARQRTGHLYVKTRDMTVSVVGTVFLVNTEEEGSRVAVIEGEVRVQQGEIETKLRPGQQVTTNPAMESQLVSQEISWSPNAKAHIALLLQNQAAIPAPSPAQEIFRPPDTPRWESVSVTPCDSDSQAGARGGGTGNPKAKLRVICTTPKLMIERAYVKWIEQGVIRPTWFFPISGGPSWIDSEHYTVEANPEGSPSMDVMKGPMMQALLEDRFKLKIRREIREEPVYELRVADSGLKLRPLKEGECAARDAAIDAALAGQTGNDRLFAQLALSSTIPPCGFVGIGGPRDGSPAPPGTRTVNVLGGPLSELIRNLSLDRIVLDATGIQGLFDIQLTYGVYTSPMREPPPLPPGAPLGEPIFSAIQRQLGLQLVPTRGPRTYYIIESADRPSAN